MRPALVVLFLFVLFSVYAAQAATDCPACSELAGRPRVQMTSLVDTDARTVEFIGYYENLTLSPSRRPLNNSVLILEITPKTRATRLYRIYTDAAGKASYNFQALSDECLQFKAVYCPFCIPETTQCGFEACMGFSRITTTARKVSDIPNAPDASQSANLNGEKYLPYVATASYCPPPQSGSETPALCLPLIILFSLLSGALYATGRNPFAGFDFSGARGSGIPARYQARGRGVSVSTMAIASAVSSIAGAAKTKKEARAQAKAEGKSDKEARQAGRVALRTQEKQAAWGRVAFAGDLTRAVRGIQAFKGAGAAAASAVKRAEAAKGAPLSAAEKRGVRANAMMVHFDARLAGSALRDGERAGGGLAKNLRGAAGGKEIATGKGNIFAPITGGSPLRGSEVAYISKSGSFMGQWLGTLTGTLGRATLALVLNSQPLQFIESFRYAFTPSDKFKPLAEVLGLVDKEKRAANDLIALNNLKEAGGVTIRLPNGQSATLVAAEQLRNERGEVTGTKVFVQADKERTHTLDGLLAINIDKKGKLESVSCVSPDGRVVALFANPEKGGPPILVFDPDRVIMKGGKSVVEVNPDSKQVGPQPGVERPEAEKLAWAKAAGPLTAALNAVGPSLLATLGGNGGKLVAECHNNVESLALINASYRSSLGAVARETEKEILKSYPPEQRKEILENGYYKIAGEAMLMALGRVASTDEFRGLKASPLSDTGTLGRTLADNAGFNKEHGFTQQQSAAMGSAIGSVLAGKSAAEISALAQDPGQLRSLLLPALSSEGISRPVAQNMLNESALKGIAGGIDSAVHEHNKAPVMAVSNIIGKSLFGDLQLSRDDNAGQRLGKELGIGKAGRFSDSQAAAASAALAQYINNSTLGELESLAKDPAKVKSIVADAFISQIASRFVAAGTSQEDALKAAQFTLQQVSGLDLKKDPLAAGGKVTPQVAEAISIVSAQLLSTGMGEKEAKKEAEAMVRGMTAPNITGISTAMSNAAQDMAAQFKKQGFSDAHISEFKNMDISQIYQLGGARGAIAPGNEEIRAQHFADMLARDMNNPDITPKVNALLQKREALLGAQMQSGLLEQAFKDFEKSGYINLPAMADRIGSMSQGYANVFNPQISQLLQTDKTFREYDKPSADTGRTVAEDFAAGAGSQANATRLERLLGVDPLATESKKIEKVAEMEESARTELRKTLLIGDAATAQALCSERVGYYRELGDAQATDAWQGALTRVAGLRREGTSPELVAASESTIIARLGNSAGSEREVATRNLDYVEAQKAAARYHMDDAMRRVEDLLSAAPPPPPAERPKSGGEPPPAPPSKPDEQPPLAGPPPPPPAERPKSGGEGPPSGAPPQTPKPPTPEQPAAGAYGESLSPADREALERVRKTNADLANPDSQLYKDAQARVDQLLSHSREYTEKQLEPVLRGEATRAANQEFNKTFSAGLESITGSEVRPGDVSAMVADARAKMISEIPRIHSEYDDRIKSAPPSERPALEAEMNNKLEYAKNHARVELDYLTRNVMDRYKIPEERREEVRESLGEIRANANKAFKEARESTFEALSATLRKKLEGERKG